MSRWAGRVVRYAVVGFLLTILVAWLVAAFLPFQTSPASMPARVQYDNLNASWVPRGLAPVRANVHLRFGVTHVNVVGERAPGARIEEFVTNSYRSGLPMRALESRIVYEARAGGRTSTRHEAGVLVPDWVRGWCMRRGYVYQSWLPLMPLWTGLVVDTAFWGLISFGVVHVVRTGRARRRARIGRCAACGYALGALARCPECGQQAGSTESEGTSCSTSETTPGGDGRWRDGCSSGC